MGGKQTSSGNGGRNGQQGENQASKSSQTDTTRDYHSDFCETSKRSSNGNKGIGMGSRSNKKSGSGGGGDNLRRHHSHAGMSEKWSNNHDYEATTRKNMNNEEKRQGIREGRMRWRAELSAVPAKGSGA